MAANELIRKLSTQPRPRFALSPTQTVLFAVTAACTVVVCAASSWLGLREDLDGSLLILDHDFLLTFAFLVSVGCAALTIVRDTAVPGRNASLPSVVVFSPFVLHAVLATHEHWFGPRQDQSLVHGDEVWLTCVWQTLVLGMSAFVILSLAMRRLAPTDLRRAGFYAGLLAGCIGAMGFCLHTMRDTAGFGVTVYTLEIGFMAAVGALLGPYLLRWR